MKIIFIEPLARLANWNFGWVSKLPFLGPVYLATILKNRGHDVEVYKESIKPISIKSLNADVLCLHTLTSSVKRAYDIAKEFKLNNPKARVVIGGIHVSLVPEEAPDYIDHVVVGEAESVIVDVIEGRIKERIINGSPCQDLDNLPYPNFSLIKYSGRMRYLPISTSRGCPFGCNFCSVTKMFGRCYRFRSPDSVIDELSKQKYRKIFFYDDNFAADRSRTKEILRQMHDSGLSKPWMTQLRVDAANDNELLRLMAKTNCDYLILGFESLSNKSLEFYNKSQRFAHIKFAIRKLHEYSIKVYGFFVFGADFDTKKSIRATVDFCDDMELERVNFTALTPLPGTGLFSMLDKDRRIFNKDWSLYDFRHVIFRPRLMSAYELQKGINDAFYRTYWLTKRGFKVFFENLDNVFSVINSLRAYNRENAEYLDFLKNIG